jgi:hypothetical protein
MRLKNVSKTVVRTLGSSSFGAVEGLADVSSGSGAGAAAPRIGTSFVAVLQVGISPAKDETDRAQVKVSNAIIRFIEIYPFLRLG